MGERLCVIREKVCEWDSVYWYVREDLDKCGWGGLDKGLINLVHC